MGPTVYQFFVIILLVLASYFCFKFFCSFVGRIYSRVISDLKDIFKR